MGRKIRRCLNKMFRKKPRNLRKLKKTTSVKVPIGLSNGKNVIVNLTNVPTYKFHRFQKKLVMLRDLIFILDEMGINTEDEATLTPEEFKRIMIEHSAFRKAKNRKFTIGGFNFEGKKD